MIAFALKSYLIASLSFLSLLAFMLAIIIGVSAAKEAESIGSPYGMLQQEADAEKRNNTPPQIPGNLLALLGGGGSSKSGGHGIESHSNG